jgi:hypothetical protein
LLFASWIVSPPDAAGRDRATTSVDVSRVSRPTLPGRSDTAWGANRQGENSDVLPAGSVAVAVMNRPPAAPMSKSSENRPSGPVVNPMFVSQAAPSPLPEGSQDVLVYTSTM